MAVTIDDQALIRKVMRRLIPFCIFCYFLNYLDRVNISVAKLKLVGTAGAPGLPNFTEDVYSRGAAIFFLGYCLFELPSNLIQERVGPRRWIARIMISWGVISIAFMFIRDPWSFYFLRFLLGFAEAGFFPGIILYLSYWIPHSHRARASAAFLTSTAISGLIGNPLGGIIQYVTEHAPLGMQSWQWLFLLEGIPSVIMGVFALFFLTDKPANASWLAPDERLRLSDVMAEERRTHPAHHTAGLKDAFRSIHTWILSLLYGLIIFSFYMVNFFTTTIVERSVRASGMVGATTAKPIVDLYVCLFSAIPFGAATVGMILIGRHSDRHNERKFHVAFACVVACAGLALAAFAPRVAGGGTSTALTITGLSLGAIGAFGIFGPFWALPPQLLTGTAAAAAFAIINSIGNFIGGFLGPMLRPYVVGRLGQDLGEEVVLLIASAMAAAAAILAMGAPVRQKASLRKFEVVGSESSTVELPPQTDTMMSAGNGKSSS
jgi:ACS family tartrate transporter-like MFS transporter